MSSTPESQRSEMVSDRPLSCLTIDFDLIKVYVPEFKADIRGTPEDHEYLLTNIKKYYYNEAHELSLDELFQAVRNYFIANSRLDLVDEIMAKSGHYSYYGCDGTGCYLPDLFIATRYANFPTFVAVLKEFGYASETSDCDDRLRRNGDIPSFMKDPGYLNIDSKTNPLLRDKNLTLYKWSRKNENPNNVDPGNIVDCDMLLRLAKLNGNEEIIAFLSKYSGRFFIASWWCDDDIDQVLEGVTDILGFDEGELIMAVPKSTIDIDTINDNLNGVLMRQNRQ